MKRFEQVHGKALYKLLFILFKITGWIKKSLLVVVKQGKQKTVEKHAWHVGWNLQEDWLQRKHKRGERYKGIKQG